MEENIKDYAERIKERFNGLLKVIDLSAKKETLSVLEKQMEEDNFWDVPTKAQKVIQEANSLKAWAEPMDQLGALLGDVVELIDEAKKEGDEELVKEIYDELKESDQLLEELEVKRMLSGELDHKDCYFSINAGAGGTEACDWVQMLARMYKNWMEKRGWKVEEVTCIPGEEAGFKSITYHVKGSDAYGYTKAEKGVHRLVRISPFDSNAKRHTSFAAVDVTPEFDDDIEIELKPEELRIDTFRASGAGGQHVNTTDSAVRILHIPTKTVVTCQNQRSQHANKDSCIRMLKGKLYEQMVEEREARQKAESGEKQENAWGSQIRNYVFEPYQLVKDTRTKHETSNINAVMDGDIEEFVTTYLKQKG